MSGDCCARLGRFPAMVGWAGWATAGALIGCSGSASLAADAPVWKPGILRSFGRLSVVFSTAPASGT